MVDGWVSRFSFLQLSGDICCLIGRMENCPHLPGGKSLMARVIISWLGKSHPCSSACHGGYNWQTETNSPKKAGGNCSNSSLWGFSQIGACNLCNMENYSECSATIIVSGVLSGAVTAAWPRVKAIDLILLSLTLQYPDTMWQNLAGHCHQVLSYNCYHHRHRQNCPEFHYCLGINYRSNQAALSSMRGEENEIFYSNIIGEMNPNKLMLILL